MLQTFEIGRLPAGQWIPGWEQGLLPLTVEPPPRTYPVARPDNAKEPAPRTETARALSDKGLSLYNLDRKDEALRVCDEMVARFGTAKEPRLREVVALALSGKGFLLYILNRTDGRSASATKLSPASAQRTSLNCADWWRGRSPAKGSCFANSTARTRRLLFATNFSATASERITSQSCAE
jgi:hypothetical protein